VSKNEGNNQTRDEIGGKIEDSEKGKRTYGDPVQRTVERFLSRECGAEVSLVPGFFDTVELR
jgi:hypothetical protein